MGYTTTKKTMIQNQLAKVQAALANLYETQLSLSTTENQSYAFDSGEGNQRATRRSFKDIQDQIDSLEAKERSLVNELYSMGLVSIRLRRKS